ncbi:MULTISPECIES: PadR family transcriptional regulator [unclassified Streptomyces]|uniref:PadR family transcriptional regulator n=1 Tax=unclassified Streptomyces TaxID=2593676 RepID=UPI0022B631EC|nr:MULTISPECIES: PadR family transcriptional regulator [unclassified Streptomyces]MCZ7415406.1 PadR family transcriptional regulator [Streptomyces sp. WMMC897]MCZ7432335.1 PadR family transcriptional regulator [Streptomyces sp. WMMC1477]
MALRNAVLAALLEGEASGYDLAKGFDASIANFWMATPQQLYRELARMEGEGLLSARVVPQERRPDKRLFSLTAAGRAALREFAARPPRPGAIRDELMVTVQAVDEVGPDAVREHLAERARWARAKLDRYHRLRERLLDGRTEEEHLRGAPRVGPYLTLLRGITFEEENLRWCERVLAVLDARAGRPEEPGPPPTSPWTGAPGRGG